MEFNRVEFCGRLTRDPQLRYLANNSTVCEFGLVGNRKYRTSSGEQRDEPCFVDCTAWGKLGEAIHDNFTRGKEIFVEARLKFDTWEDKQGGHKRSKLSLVVTEWHYTGPRAADGVTPVTEKPDALGPLDGPSKPRPRPRRAAADPDTSDRGDDDIPF